MHLLKLMIVITSLCTRIANYIYIHILYYISVSGHSTCTKSIGVGGLSKQGDVEYILTNRAYSFQYFKDKMPLISETIKIITKKVIVNPRTDV